MHATTRLLVGWCATFHMSIASEFSCHNHMPLFFICWSLGMPWKVHNSSSSVLTAVAGLQSNTLQRYWKWTLNKFIKDALKNLQTMPRKWSFMEFPFSKVLHMAANFSLQFCMILKFLKERLIWSPFYRKRC